MNYKKSRTTKLSEEIDKILGDLKPTSDCSFSREHVPDNIRNILSYVAHKQQPVPAALVDRDGGHYQPFLIKPNEIYHTVLTDQISSTTVQDFDEGLLAQVLGLTIDEWREIYYNRTMNGDKMMQVKMSIGEDTGQFDCVVWAWKGFARYPELFEKFFGRR